MKKLYGKKLAILKEMARGAYLKHSGSNDRCWINYVDGRSAEKIQTSLQSELSLERLIQPVAQEKFSTTYEISASGLSAIAEVAERRARSTWNRMARNFRSEHWRPSE